MKLLFPDARFAGEPDVEQRAAGADAEIVVRAGKTVADVPPADWAAADAIFMYNEMHLTDEAAALATNCRIVVRVGVGYDKIDVAAFGRRGIPVCNTPDYGTTDVADMALAMLLALARGVASFDQALKADPVGNWRFDLGPCMRRLRGQSFGVLGLGRIGTAAALRARAFGMDVGFFDPALPSGTELALGFRRFDSIGALFAASDAVSIHCPLTPETRGLVDGAVLAEARPGMLLINTARGPIVDLDALTAALRGGRIAGAGLDVIPQEPPDPAHPLIRAYMADEAWIKGRLLLAPHAAFYSPDAFEDMRRLSVVTAVMYLREGRLRNCVNRDTLAQGG